MEGTRMKGPDLSTDSSVSGTYRRINDSSVSGTFKRIKMFKKKREALIPGTAHPPDQEGEGCSIGAWLQHQGLPIPLAPQYNVSAICEYWVQVMNFLWVDPKKRGVSKKKFSYFFMLYLDSANKKSDRTRYQFFHPTTPTPPNRPPPSGHTLTKKCRK